MNELTYFRGSPGPSQASRAFSSVLQLASVLIFYAMKEYRQQPEPVAMTIDYLVD